jgi:hypothetical protein
MSFNNLALGQLPTIQPFLNHTPNFEDRVLSTDNGIENAELYLWLFESTH